MKISLYHMHETEQYATSYGMMNRAIKCYRSGDLVKYYPAKTGTGRIRDGAGTVWIGGWVDLVHPRPDLAGVNSGDGVRLRRGRWAAEAACGGGAKPRETRAATRERGGARWPAGCGGRRSS